MEKFFSPDKVIGNVSREEKKRLILEKQAVFENQNLEDLKEFEIEKSPEILEAINLANRVTNELRIKYGLEEFNIPAENIHIIKHEFADKTPLGSFKAMFEPDFQRIVMSEIRIENFSQRLIHEMLHMKGQHSFQIDKESKAVDYHREGFRLISRKEKDFEAEYFTVLDEAMTEEINKRIVRREMANDNSVFNGLASKTQQAFEKHPKATDYTGEPIFHENTFYAEERTKNFFMKLLDSLAREKSGPVVACNFGYRREQEILNILIDKIFEKNHDKFNDREEVYLLFEKGYVTGNMFRVGILIDRTFGKGAFRKIGNFDFALNEKLEQQQFLDSL